tara:strand:+ start:6246 stop:7580 length:1335 start_codon:yes stop_codon:yes gene_type:complete
MKRNLILFVVLTALLTITWLINEKGGDDHRHELAKAEMVFDPKTEGGLLSLSFEQTTLYLNGDKFFVGEKRIPANPFKVEELFSTLDSLAAVRKLSEEETRSLDMNLAFPKDRTIDINFRTSKGITLFQIGAPIETSPGKFYAMLGNQVLIVHDRKPLLMAYAKEDEADIKYKRLQAIFSIPPDFFYDTRLFKDELAITAASFDNPKAKPYSVDFLKQQTRPLTYPSIAYDQREMKAWLQTLLKLEAGSIIPDYNPKLLKKLRAQIKLKSKDGKSVELSLFSGYGSLKGDFVISSLSPYLFELADNQAGLFFQNLQDFWSLSLNLPSEKLPLIFSAGANTISATLVSGKIFEVEVADENLSPKRQFLAVLYNLLTGRARYISDLIDLKYKANFVIKYANRSFVFATSADEWLIIDSANKLAYHYLKRDYPDLPANLDNYFGSPE